MDSEEKQILKDLHKNFEEQWAEKQNEAEKGLQEELNNARSNSVKPLNDNNIQELTNNYWTQKQPELDQTKQNLGNEMFRDWGGSEEAALEKLNEDGQQQIQEAKELQENQQLDMQNDVEKQQEFAQEQQRNKDEKEKKEKEKQVELDKDKQRQMHAEQSKKQKEELERDRLRQQFNNDRGGQERDR